MLAIFLFSGIGNASHLQAMPMIFERRQAGGVIGWTAAIAAFGPFFFGVGITAIGATAFYSVGIVWAVMCVAITWVRYARGRTTAELTLIAVYDSQSVENPVDEHDEPSRERWQRRGASNT